MRKSALIKRSMTQIPKAVHQSGTGEKTLEKLIYFRYKSINIGNGLAYLYWNDDFVLTLLVVNLSLYQTLLIFLLMRSKLDSIDYSKSSVRGYILLIRKDSVTHVHSLAVCVKERLPFSLDLSLGVLIYFFNLPSFFVTLLSLSQPLFSSSGSVFQFVSSNIVEDLLINPSAYVFVLRDFNVYHKDWLTYSDGTGRSGELYCNFFYLKPPYADGKRSYSDT